MKFGHRSVSAIYAVDTLNITELFAMPKQTNTHTHTHNLQFTNGCHVSELHLLDGRPNHFVVDMLLFYLAITKHQLHQTESSDLYRTDSGDRSLLTRRKEEMSQTQRVTRSMR